MKGASYGYELWQRVYDEPLTGRTWDEMPVRANLAELNQVTVTLKVTVTFSF